MMAGILGYLGQAHYHKRRHSFQDEYFRQTVHKCAELSVDELGDSCVDEQHLQLVHVPREGCSRQRRHSLANKMRANPLISINRFSFNPSIRLPSK